MKFMKGRLKNGLVLLILILIVLSIVFGLLVVKKSKSSNKTVENSKPSNSQNLISESGNPDNAVIITCPDCGGSGNVVCPECEGRGLYYICNVCNGKYHTYLNTCPFCGSRNTLIQHACSETIKCPRCGGSGQIPSQA